MITGLLTGAVVTVWTSYLLLKQVKTERHYAEKRIEEYERAFQKGYEAKNGITPFIEAPKPEETEKEYVYSDEEEEWDTADDKQGYERWDD